MKEKILEAMYHHVAKQGYEKTSLSQLAQAVHIQKPSIYYHFKSKEEILLETVNIYYHDLYEIPMSTLESITTPEEYLPFLQNFGINSLSKFENDEELQQFSSEINLQSLRIPSLEKNFIEYEKVTQHQLTTLLNKGISLGSLKPTLSPEIETQTITALFIGLSEMLLYRMKADCTAVWNNYVNSLLK